MGNSKRVKSDEVVTVAEPVKLPFITAYGPHLKVDKEFTKESETKSDMKEECDINKIVAGFSNGKVPANLREITEANYGSFDTEDDYASAMSKVVAAQQAFEALPSELRAEFQNDPGQFLDYVNNPDNEAALVERGLLPPQQAGGNGDGEAPATGEEKEKKVLTTKETPATKETVAQEGDRSEAG